MKRFGIFLFALLLVLPSCGKRKLAKKPATLPPAQAEEQVALDLESDKEESLFDNVNSQRLEELYSKNASPDLQATLDQEVKKWEMQKTFDMPIQVNKEVRNYIYYFSTDKKAVFSRYLSRSSRYLPMINKVFAQYGLPADLAYLAMIESGYTTKARSHANAVGMWQFIKGTGLRYGLTIDGTVDERRDPEKATDAAARYLLDLYKQFGSWYLAAASYNCGEGRVQKEINRNGDLKNFWELSNNLCLPNETKNYVPQMIAATIIAKNPEKYGFKNIPYQPPLKYDAVKIAEATSLQAAAVASGTSFEEISNLNPELLRDSTPGGTYLLKIPSGKKEAFGNNIMMARAQFPAWGGRAYAARADDDDSDYAPPSRSSKSSRQYASAPQPKAKPELRVRAAKAYDDLPSLNTSKQQKHRTEVAAKTQGKSKSKKEIVVASHAPTRSAGKETSRRSVKSDKPQGPVTASMVPGVSSSKKTAKKETTSIARKPSSSSKSKKKKNNDD